MAKIALISDTHYGVRSDNKALLENQVLFFENIFFPYLDKMNIKHVINLGDTVDRRKYINFQTSQILTASLIQPLYDRQIESHFILGNHDVTYKDTNRINALDELYGNSKYLDYMKIYTDPKEINIAGCNILLLPWICKENKDISYEFLKTSKATAVMGHLEISGFEMYKGSISDHGFDRSVFNNFDIVCSGHYHHKSTIGNINYLGSTGQYTWSDYGDARGFHIFDTETRSLEFIQNPYHMFNKFVYDDINKSEHSLINFDPSIYEGSYVKIIVKNKNNPYLLEKVVENFENYNIINLQIIEDKNLIEIENEEEIIDEAEDTIFILKKYISSMTNDNKENLEKFMIQLYFEAQNVA